MMMIMDFLRANHCTSVTVEPTSGLPAGGQQGALEASEPGRRSTRPNKPWYWSAITLIIQLQPHSLILSFPLALLAYGHLIHLRSLMSCVADIWSCSPVQLWAGCSGWSRRRQMGTHALDKGVISFAFPGCQKCLFLFFSKNYF